jgi:hypothetical protein
LRRMIDQRVASRECDGATGEALGKNIYSLRSIARGMVYVHNKSVHGDLVPSNVLLRCPLAHACLDTLTA